MSDDPHPGSPQNMSDRGWIIPTLLDVEARLVEQHIQIIGGPLMPAASKPLVALTTVVIATEDGDLIVRRGAVVPANHTVAKANPELFQPHDPAKPLVEPPVVEAG